MTIVDVLEELQAAPDIDVLVTPTLPVDGPRGRSTIIANPSDLDRTALLIGTPD